MNDQERKAMEMALDVLLNEYALGTERNPSPYDTIKALEAALAQPEQAPVTKSGLYSTAGRLALELECLLLDTKDISIVSKWWDSAHEALDQWREFHLRACTELDSAEITKSCDSKPESDAMRLYQSVARLAMQADGDVGETIDWLCGEHGGMFKLFESYFSPKPLANQTVASGSPIDSPTNIAVLSINSSDSATRSADSAETFGKTEQEPFAWMYEIFGDRVLTTDQKKIDLVIANGITATPLYTAPPSKPFIGLDNADLAYQTPHDVIVMRYAEAILKDKNT